MTSSSDASVKTVTFFKSSTNIYSQKSVVTNTAEEIVLAKEKLQLPFYTVTFFSERVLRLASFDRIFLPSIQLWRRTNGPHLIASLFCNKQHQRNHLWRCQILVTMQRFQHWGVHVKSLKGTDFIVFGRGSQNVWWLRNGKRWLESHISELWNCLEAKQLHRQWRPAVSGQETPHSVYCCLVISAARVATKATGSAYIFFN